MKLFTKKTSKKAAVPKGIAKKKVNTQTKHTVREDDEASDDPGQDENEVEQANFMLRKPADDEDAENAELDEDLGTDEEDSDEDEANISPVKKQHTSEETPQKPPRKKEYSVFVGNLPPSMKANKLKSMFKQYGNVETVRLRNTDGQKVFYKSDLKHVKSLIGYVRFAAKEEMTAACALNGTMIGDNRIRVCPHDKKQIGSVQATVFVGNIHKGTTENELYDFFSRAGDIEYIRQIEQKCIAYVCFKKSFAKKKALKMDQKKLNNRPLRVQDIDTQRSNWRLNKKGHQVKNNQKAQKANGAGGKAEKKTGSATADFHGTVTDEKPKSKKGQSFKRGKGSAKDKKILAGKLKAAMVLKPAKA
uniref:RRM domain-containing protein n=1 Tax=Anopheles dirus TaxID=7168 RepID=A0A182NFS5_9DIPT